MRINDLVATNPASFAIPSIPVLKQYLYGVWPFYQMEPSWVQTFRICAFGHQRWQGLTCQPGNDFCPPLGLGPAGRIDGVCQ